MLRQKRKIIDVKAHGDVIVCFLKSFTGSDSQVEEEKEWTKAGQREECYGM